MRKNSSVVFSLCVDHSNTKASDFILLPHRIKSLRKLSVSQTVETATSSSTSSITPRLLTPRLQRRAEYKPVGEYRPCDSLHVLWRNVLAAREHRPNADGLEQSLGSVLWVTLLGISSLYVAITVALVLWVWYAVFPNFNPKPQYERVVVQFRDWLVAIFDCLFAGEGMTI